MQGSIFVMIISIMITMITSVSLTNDVYAGKENKPKEYCKDYGGEWNDKKDACEIENKDKRTYYEDDVCDDPDDSLRYPKVCQPWLFEGEDDDDDDD